nr:MAG TPA: protein of unknown function DUF1244 [Caudoviricetes sp.]
MEEVVRCKRCHELTWKDNFHTFNEEVYCTNCLKEVLASRIEEQQGKINKAINILNEGVYGLMPYEIYKGDVEEIRDKVINILKEED